MGALKFLSGKTGGQWLIAKHRAVDVLKRLHSKRIMVLSLNNFLTNAQQTSSLHLAMDINRRA